MIHVIIRERSAQAQATEPITAGSVGLEVRFRFSEDWEGLGKIAVFRGSGRTVDSVLTGSACPIPHEVLQSAGGHLHIGVYGTGAEGQKVTPTVWADAGPVLEGALPGGIPAAPASQSLVQQILEAAQAARSIAQSVRDDADAGAFDGADAAVDATLSRAGEAADAEETGKVKHTAEYARLFAETLNAGAGIPLDAVWQKGGIADNGNNQNTRTYRARAAGRLHYDAEITLVCDEHHQFFLVRFNAFTDEWIGATNWGRSRTVPSTESFRICVRRSPEDTSLEADPEEFGAAVRIRNNMAQGGAVSSVNGQTGAVTISVPTKTSDLQNDSGFLTRHQDIGGKLDIAQGAANAGKFLVVGSDGAVTAVAMTAWQGGSY